MGIIFKKGHIIPRWCHVKTVDRKAQHNCTFGCDVEVMVSGGVVKMCALSTGRLIDIKGRRGPSRRMKGGSTKYSMAVVEHVHGDFSRVNDASVVQLNGTDNFAPVKTEFAGATMPTAMMNWRLE